MPVVPLGHDDQDDRLLALAALVMAGIDPDGPREQATTVQRIEVVEPVDDLATRRQRRTDEQALARSRHPSARRRQSA